MRVPLQAISHSLYGSLCVRPAPHSIITSASTPLGLRCFRRFEADKEVRKVSERLHDIHG